MTHQTQSQTDPFQTRTVITNVNPQTHRTLTIVAAELGITRERLYATILTHFVNYSRETITDMIDQMRKDHINP